MRWVAPTRILTPSGLWSSGEIHHPSWSYPCPGGQLLAPRSLPGRHGCTIEATRLALGRRNAFQWEINGSRGSLAFDMERLNELQVFRADGEGYLPNAFSQLFIIDADGGAARQVTQGDFDHQGPPAFTADGRSVLIVPEIAGGLTAGLTLPVMQELNSRVDLDKQKPAAVATEYLKEAGYLQ